MHKRGMAHLDLKPSNLMLSSNYQVKIIDFDLSAYQSDKTILSSGTRDFRAPELRKSKVKDMVKADIFSLGVILFVMKTSGILPFREPKSDETLRKEEEIDLDVFKTLTTMNQMLDENPRLFWKTFCKMHNHSDTFFSFELKSLI